MNQDNEYWTKHISKEDLSINFLKEVDAGKHEARYVRRNDDYFIVYLSSHNGCRTGCRFCHLTQMREKSFAPVTVQEYIEQSKQVFEHYDSVLLNKEQKPAARVHFNFMARGEALANLHLIHEFADIKGNLETMARERGLGARFKVSTIYPKSFEENTEDLTRIAGHNVAIYYSLYSLEPKFRTRWLPNAENPYLALERLREWQETTSGRVVLHWPLIAGHNDSAQSARDILRAVNNVGIKTKYNLVRYNTPSPNQGEESSESVRDEYFKIISEGLSEPSRLVPRVGYDVAASCGMFL